MQFILSNHPARKDYQSSEDFDSMIEDAQIADTNPF
jgi:hypothetical protein